MLDSQRDTDVKNRLLDSVGEGEGGMILENSIETRILPYVKQIASPGSMRGRCKRFRMGNTCTPMAESCECMAKTTTIL